jgi:recombination protein RecA
MKKEKKEKEVKVVSGDRAKRLEDLVGSLKKNHGDGAVFYGHGPIKAEDKVVPTGSMILDSSAGIGGLPAGRIVEIFGPEASGKSTLCLSIVAEAQKKGLTCAYIDTEHALDAKYAKKLGVNIDSLILSQPDFAEQALDIFKEVAESGAVDVIILDSVAALVPKAELEGETADQSMGVQARMMSKMLRVLAGILNKNKCLGVFINQIRMKIGVMYGSPETTPGGNALKFYASMRLRVSRGETFGGEPAKGHMINVKFVKNKMAPPFTECQVPLIYGQGIDQAGDLYTIAKEWGVLDVRGAHSYFNGQKFASSRDEAVAKLRADSKVFSELDNAVRAELKKRQESGVVELEEEEESEE